MSPVYPSLGVEVLPARPEHLVPVAERMRPEDALEVRLASGHEPLQALEASLAVSRDLRGEVRAWTILHHGRPEALFGVGRASLLSDVGVPWMLGTEEISRGGADGLAIPFARHCAAYVAEMERGFARLENYVHTDNRFSIRWLKWLGFSFDPPAPYGLHRALFRRFWKDV